MSTPQALVRALRWKATTPWTRPKTDEKTVRRLLAEAADRIELLLDEHEEGPPDPAPTAP
jgi:hypothetical protein